MTRPDVVLGELLQDNVSLLISLPLYHVVVSAASGTMFLAGSRIMTTNLVFFPAKEPSGPECQLATFPATERLPTPRESEE